MTARNNPNALVRDRALKARRELTAEFRRDASANICDNVIHSGEFMSAKSIACYLSCKDEVDTHLIIHRAWRAKKRIFAPVIDFRGNMIFRQMHPESELCKNTFGMWEPVSGPSIDARLIDIVITPLVAFDDQCHRIGMGGGYFDRSFHFLGHRRKWLRPKLVGIAFACQKISAITPNPWDIRLSRVIDESS